MFMHAGSARIRGNMLFLWIFGNNVGDALGHVGFFLVPRGRRSRCRPS
jgi:membrane associated rhomboid family serine protease